jgi:hypothetical protein
MPRTTRRAAAVALTFLLAACTGGDTLQLAPLETSAPPAATPDPKPSSPSERPGSSAATLERLCPGTPPPQPPPVPVPEGGPPPAIASIEHEVESVRGLEFEEDVAVGPVSQQEMARRVQRSLDDSLPIAYLARRSQAWATIGAVPEGTDVREALLRFLTGNVIGFYQPSNDELVFVGTESPGPGEHITLAHELTHAIEDQHFDLTRIDEIQVNCQDETGAAALAAVEGSAQFFSAEVARRYLSVSELGGLFSQQVPSAEDVPPFLVQQQVWPYIGGLTFVTAIHAAGGTRAVNRALRHLPASTEQVIHPGRYPNDRPQTVEVHDLGPKLGGSWRDLDVEQVGEAWLSALLGLRMDQADAAAAAAGWDGGLARSWTDGSATAVVLATVWDSARDAEEFASAMRTWSAGSGAVSVEPPTGASVRVLFASEGPTLDLLTRAAA